MKNQKQLVSLLVAVSTLYAGSIYAAASTTFTVSATVVNACQVSAGNLTFPNYDGTSGNAVQATSAVNVTCTSGANYNVGLNAGTGVGASVTTRDMSSPNGKNQLEYSLYQDASDTTVWGNTPGKDAEAGTGTGKSQSLTVNGKIPGGQVIPASGYQDTITVTVTF
ncbi:MAG: spore coat U domain-containing protein [Gammaproteobacteria bacterium]|nr:spore coat U domain-containing protein [Gammaproteobacteria bacterium]